MAPHGVISADSHVTEPADLWQERLDRKFRDRAPYVTKNPGEGPAWLFMSEGAAPFPVAGGFAAGRSGKELVEFFEKGYEAARPSGWDPTERIADQELDGIDAEVLYPNLGMKLFAMSSGELQRACFQAYNAWLAEFCQHDPARLYGVGLVSLEDISSAVPDVEAIAKQGMRGVMVWGSPPEDRPYNDPLYDPFWAAAEEADLPVSLHIIAGRGRTSNGVVDAIQGRAHSGIWYMSVLHEIQDSLTRIIFSGVLHRFPNLKIVSAENDTGWLPHYMYRMDHCDAKYRALWPDAPPEPPSFYIRRQIFATFQDDPVGPATHELFGRENYMWASDFPHSDSTFPESRMWIDKNFAGVPEDVRHRIVHANVAELYGMELPSKGIA
ncbi:MAG: amidohydrolase [bacterium]|nr:amidohydrolase [Deltaproteobacteria bacterium]MCP4904011.1 amidohydrolase [bacterium]